MLAALVIFIITILGVPKSEAQATVPLTVQPVAGGFVQPVGVYSPRTDPTRLFVVELGGTIRIIKNGIVLNTPFLDITNKVQSGGEEGLLGLAFDPDYKNNGRFFVYYNRQPDIAIVLERYLVSATNPDVANAASGETYLVIPKPFSGHNGGSMAFSPLDGLLYIGVGDGGSGGDPLNNAQDINSLLGKILRINVNFSTPEKPYLPAHGNPYFGPADGLDEIYAIGIRNPWKMTFDRLSGDLYIADVGQELSEEVNYIPEGAAGFINFGWRCMEGPYCTSYSGPVGCICNDPTLAKAIHTYDHPTGCAIIGGYVYRGHALPEYTGEYFFGDLCTKKMWSFAYDGIVKTAVKDLSTDLAPPSGSHTFASFGEDANGELYIVYHSGEIGRIARASLQLPGVSSYGSGTPGCAGSQQLSAETPAKINIENFYLRATNAPANSMGIGFMATSPSNGIDLFGIGANILLDLIGSQDVILYDMPTDENGMGYSVFAIPNNPAIVGQTYYIQSLFYWDTQCTSVLPLGFSSTDGLAATVQN
ncbi:MAG: PQQ-dependent sugar dehydrogenase [Planctomycetota bacterium]